MSKRNKQKAKQKAKEQRAAVRQQRSNQREQFAEVGMQVFSLIEDEKPLEALDLISPLLEQYPRSVELQTLAGLVYSQIGDPWATIDAFEFVQKQNSDPMISAMIRDAYLAVDMPIYALQAARRALKADADEIDHAELQSTIDDVEQKVALIATRYGISVTQAETGLRHQEDGYRALENGEYQACIDASRRAIRFLGNWPPAHNNLAKALFFQGHPADAVTTTQHVLEQEPDNLYALSNAIKFLAWIGKEDEARPLWERLRGLEPQTDLERTIIAEAAAVLEEDESVYQFLKPVVEAKALINPLLAIQAIYRLVIAEANLKRVQSAIERMDFMQEEPHFKRVYEALKTNRPGLGYATRFSYFSVSEILPTNAFDAMMKLMDEYQSLDEDQFAKRRDRHNERFPQSILAAKMLIWDEMQVQAGIVWLAAIGTPESFEILREVGLSQLGTDNERIGALLALVYEGWLDPDDTVRVWQGGKWQEKTLTQLEVEEEDKLLWSPSPETEELLAQGDEAFHRGDFAEAERIFQQVVTLEPNAFPAYHQLAVTYLMLGDREQAKAMLYQALEINPGFSFARISLAILHLDDEELEEAKQVLLPLSDLARLNDQETNLLLLTEARISAREGRLEEAVEVLTDLLDAEPGFTPAIELLESIEQVMDSQTVEGQSSENKEN